MAFRKDCGFVAGPAGKSTGTGKGRTRRTIPRAGSRAKSAAGKAPLGAADNVDVKVKRTLSRTAKMAGRTAITKGGVKSVRKTTASSEKKLGALVAKALPGWKIVDTSANAGGVEDAFVRIERGPSIADLRRKFLHEDGAEDADIFDSEDGRMSVRIRPEQGGDAKTADVGPDGKVTIVQG
jgi:hypothetical protein